MAITIKVRVPNTGGTVNQDIYFHQTTNVHDISLPTALADQQESVQMLLLKLLPYESQIMSWLSISSVNAAAFIADPVTAIEKSGLGIPVTLLAEIKTLSSHLAAKVGGN